MKVRLNRFLSLAGVASRRQADQMIAEGRVQVNGRVVDELGTKINDERDLVQVDGKTVRKEEGLVYVMLNKPSGYLVTLKDPFHRPTIKNLLPDLRQRVFPVGRLDLESKGLLLLTNDGELANRLAHPRYQVKKTYVVTVKGKLEMESLARLEKGVVIEGQKTAPAKVAYLAGNPKKSILRIEIHEGRKREVRLMCQAVGYPVLDLKRVGFAGLNLEKLKPGEWRFLKPQEIKKLRRMVGMKPG